MIAQLCWRGVLRECRTHDEVLEMLGGQEHLSFRMKGVAVGTTTGVPFYMGNEYSVDSAENRPYRKCIQRSGGIVEHEGRTYVVVWNDCRNGTLPNHQDVILMPYAAEE